MASSGPMRCPLCLKPFEQPKLLQKCMHSFCKSCLYKCIESSFSKSGSKETKCCCPICRTEFEGPTSSKSLYEWLERLPSDDILTGLLAAHTSSKDRYCEPCNISKRQASASKQCKECCEILCDQCAALHRSFKEFRSHTLIDIDDSSTLFTGFESYASCNGHKEQSLEYYCNTHEELICSKCVIAKHRKCVILDVEDVSEKLNNKIQIESVLSDLKTLKKSLTLTESSIKKESDIFEEETLSTLSTIEDKRKKINDAFDKYKQQVKKLTGEHSDKISQMRHENQTLLTGITNSLGLMENVMNNGNNLQTFFLCQAMDRQLKGSKRRLEEYKCNRLSIAYDNKFSPSVIALADSIDGVGKFSIGKRTAGGQAEIQLSEKNDNILTKTGAPQLVSAKQKCFEAVEVKTLKTASKTDKKQALGIMVEPQIKRTVKVKTTERFSVHYPNDSIPFFGGAAFLEDDRVVLTDVIYYTIILLNSSFSYVSRLKFNKRPRKVTAISEDEVAVNLQRTKMIYIVKCNKTMSVIRSINVDDFPISIFCHNGTVFVSSSSSPPPSSSSSLCNIELELKSINQNGDISCYKQIRDLYDGVHFVVFNKEDKVYLVHSCRNGDMVYCQTLNGEKTFSYKFLGPCGVDVDKYGNIVVASIIRDKLLLLTPDGQMIKSIDTGRLVKPYEVRMNWKQNKILVTQYQNPEICVINLTYS